MDPTSEKWLLHVWNPSDASRVLCGIKDFLASVSPEWARDSEADLLCPKCFAVLNGGTDAASADISEHTC